MTEIQSNGIRLQYDDAGRATDPAIVFIIGFGLQLIAWPQDLIDGLVEAGFRVIRFDNRDTGLSQRFPDAGLPDVSSVFAARTAGLPFDYAYDENDMADDVADLIAGLGLSSAHVVGMSMGGRIAQRVALRQPRRVASLTAMITSSGDPKLPPGNANVMKTLMTPPEDPTSRKSYVANGMKIARALKSPGFKFDAKAARRGLEAAFDRSPEIDGYMRNMVAMIAAPPFHYTLTEITAPTMVLHGDADPVLPVAHAEDLVRRIRGAKLHLIEGWSHEIQSPDVIPLLVTAISEHCRAAA
ncbi:MAG: alpha/beta hydrolase [Alphaproteobacteria bacterium]|jgi:pimeloyl-ACP methyl ester carboxylesterase|nr:alpha/beta hydrolase [Rhodospirillaceae bacterium]MDP6404187.1 alpha/beta hydrolase [Alphaproteobacteria bacterium]MDP6623404.1 alpha/beta hydrolase [Alphaproteobacteria bacterium]|tara:strand:- start:658 stop:1551 length:894 start_codon:yes stop_codon:yes gene_type:complete